MAVELLAKVSLKRLGSPSTAWTDVPMLCASPRLHCSVPIEVQLQLLPYAENHSEARLSYCHIKAPVMCRLGAAFMYLHNGHHL